MKLIDKDALVAEIERLWNEYKNNDEDNKLTWFVAKLENFLDTLEVTEVDLEKEIDKWYNNEASKEFERVFYDDVEKCAKHFFEVGLLASNKTQKGEEV